MENKHSATGYSLLECLMCICIVGLLFTIALPSFSDAQRRVALRTTLTQSYLLLKQAKQLAIEHQRPISAVVQSQPSWCIGLTTKAVCDCHQQSSCMVNGQSYRLETSSPIIELRNVTFAEGNRTQFDGIHGTAYGHAGSIVYSDGQRQGKVIVNNLGRVRLCVGSGELKGYATCG